MRRAQAHDRLPFKDRPNGGIRTLSGKGEILLHAGLHLIGIRSAQHPQLVERGRIHMEDLGQTPHLQRLILQNSPHQLMDRNCAVLPPPDIDADPHRVCRLLR